MSEVVVREMPHDLKNSVRQSPLIVVARDLQQRRIFKEVVFPKSTHHQKERTTTYREFVRRFKIKRIVKSDLEATPNIGSIIDVWVKPAYDEAAARQYHEQGLSKSIVVPEATPRSKPQRGEVILFLEPYGKIFRRLDFTAEEGLGALAEVEELVRSLATPVLWYMEDRSAFHRDGKAVIFGEDGTLFVHIIERQGQKKLREKLCLAKLDSQTLSLVQRMVEATRWEKLEFSGTLTPDETRPSLYVGRSFRRTWTIEPARPGPEGEAYQSLLRIAFEKCESTPWTWKNDTDINFRSWPPGIQEISQ